MPSAPNPDSPFMDSRVEAALGIRAPGSPSSAGKPGVQVGDVSFPAPPSVNTGAPGRPSAPSTPAPVAAPSQPAQPAAASAQGGRQQGVSGSGTIPAAPSATGAQQALNGLPAGAAVATPLGVASTGPDGQQQLSSLTPEGAQRYREVVVQKRAELGPIPGIFRNPALGEMPVEVGRWNYNPFTGSWVK